MSDAPVTRTGKVATLPARIRDQVNVRLHDGQKSPQIIAWLHTLPEVLTVLDEQWNEEPFNATNISEWRRGGYQDWLRRREEIENTKLLSEYALEIVKRGDSITEAAAVIAGGKLLEGLETLAADPENAETLTGFATAVAKLQDGGAKQLRAKVSVRNADQKDRQLDLDTQKFQRGTAEMFLKWAKTPEAQAILNGGDTKSVQMDKLVQLMFGTRPTE